MRSAKAFMLSWFALLAILPSLTHPSPVEVNEDDNDHFIGHHMNPDLFEGDIILPKDSRSAIQQWWNMKWDEGIVPYEIDDKLQNELLGDDRIVADGIEMFNSEDTCVKFVQRTNQRDYIIFTLDNNGPGCSSMIGRWGGRQKISVNPKACSRAVIVHEMMHAIGFFHEQNRPDRDNYVTINWGNIKTHPEKNLSTNFVKEDESDKQDLPYDYCSIMHYHPSTFSINWPTRPTIEVLGNVNVRDLCDHELGAAKSLSKLDIEGVNRLYECPNQPTQPTTTRSTAPSVTNPIGEPTWVTDCGYINRMAELHGDYSLEMNYLTKNYYVAPDENGMPWAITSHVYCAGRPRKTNRSYEEGVTICKQSFRKGQCPYYLHAGNVMFRCGYDLNCSINMDKK